MVLTVNKPDVRRFITWIESADWNPWLCRIYFLILLRWASKSPWDLVFVFCSVIWSILEYDCEAWHPKLIRECSINIEYLQVQVLNLAYAQLDYHDALREAGIEALEQRRKTLLILSKSYLWNSRPYEPLKVRTECCKKSPINYDCLNFNTFFN